MSESSAPAARRQPTLRDMFQLQLPYQVKCSPNGAKAAIGLRTTNWKENCYENLCLVQDIAAATTLLLTRAGNISQVEWLDDQTLILLRSGPNKDDKPQLWVYEGLTGDGWQVTGHKTGVEWFKPFAGGVLFRAANPEKDENKARSDRFGKYLHYEQEDSTASLYYFELEALRAYQDQLKASTEDEAKSLVQPLIELSRLFETSLAIRSVVASPTGDAIYLNCWPRDDLVYWRQASHYQITLDASAALQEFLRRAKEKQQAEKDAPPAPDSARKEEKEDFSYLGRLTRLNLPASAWIQAVSPDGRKLLLSHPERDDKMYTQADLWIVDAAQAQAAPDAAACLAQMRKITAELDREVLDTYWVANGIFASFVDHQVIRIARLTEDGQVIQLNLQGVFPALEFHVSAGGYIGLVGGSATQFFDAYRFSPVPGIDQLLPERLTNYARAVEDWELGVVETIRWQSKDGVEIEGVLRKPANFDPAKRYPLLFVVHGGPTWFSGEYLLSGEDLRYYPSIQFVNQEMLVLKPNYRGSVGRGQAFMELNVNNLGVGDLWDLESAIDHLVALGWVDPQRVGCMGWSQGGYISAFAGLHSERFKAVSVGAGISDWYTYHISNDIPDFTVDFLSGSPFENREIYLKTAPISNLQNAKTPMLIQHGSEDRRVPLSNAHELYRGLKARGVPVELFIYPGMAHPITKPRQNYAVLHQNLTWFNHYLLGAELNLE